MTENKPHTNKPKASSSLAQQELDKCEKQFESYDENIKSLTLDRMNEAPKLELEPQTKISQKDMDKMRQMYIKPHKTIGCREKFNETYRDQWNFAKEYVNFTAENKEIIGETMDFWTKPFAGVPAEEWKIPANKPVWAPRYVAERLKGCSYHRMTMDESQVASADGRGTYYGQMVVDNTVQRLDAIPVSPRKSVFMGA